MSDPAGLVDWARAEQVAIKVAARQPAPPYELDGGNPPIERIEEQIADVTGLRSAAGTATADVIDRAAWVQANIASFRGLLEPVLTKLEPTKPASGGATFGSFSRQMAGAQLG